MTTQYKSFDLGARGWAINLGLIDIKWDPHALVDKKVEIPRSLWERLFSFPWRPLQKTKIIVTKEPVMFSFKDPITFEMKFVCHPAFKERIFQEFALVEVI